MLEGRGEREAKRGHDSGPATRRCSSGKIPAVRRFPVARQVIGPPPRVRRLTRRPRPPHHHAARRGGRPERDVPLRGAQDAAPAAHGGTIRWVVGHAENRAHFSVWGRNSTAIPPVTNDVSPRPRLTHGATDFNLHPASHSLKLAPQPVGMLLDAPRPDWGNRRTRDPARGGVSARRWGGRTGVDCGWSAPCRGPTRHPPSHPDRGRGGQSSERI